MTEDPIEEIGLGATIRSDIWALHLHIAEYRKQLNNEGMWLFLSTLGCWSVTHRPLQFFALVLTVLLFGFRLTSSLKELRSFDALIKVIEKRIDDAEAIPAAKDKLRKRLKNEQNQSLSARRSMKEGGVFLLCWLFFTGTFVVALYSSFSK